MLIYFFVGTTIFIEIFHFSHEYIIEKLMARTDWTVFYSDKK